MRPASRLLLVCAAPLVALYWAPRPATAGVSLWTSRDLVNSLYVELTRPDLEVDEQGAITAGGSVEVVFVAAPGFGLVARLPVAFADVTHTIHLPHYYCPDTTCTDTTWGVGYSYSGSEVGVGNLYAGIRGRPPGLPALTLELGVHAPTATGGGWATDLVGVGADLTQWEDYRTGTTLDAAARIRPRRRGRLADVWEIRWIADVENLNYTLYMDFLGRVLLGYRLGAATRVWGGLDARLSSSSGPTDPILAQAVLATTTEFGAFRPGLHVRLPLSDDLRSASTWAIGLSCEVSPWDAERTP